MEFLDGFKPVDPANKLREWKRRTVAWASGALAAGSHVELCLTEHPHKEPSNQPELPLGYIDRSRV